MQKESWSQQLRRITSYNVCYTKLLRALKHASLIKKKYPETEITICYIDVRAFGFYENYYRAVQETGVHFVRGRPAEVVEKPDKSLVVRVEDTLDQKMRELPADLVVLSAAMVPSPGTRKIASVMNLSQDESGFSYNFV